MQPSTVVLWGRVLGVGAPSFDIGGSAVVRTTIIIPGYPGSEEKKERKKKRKKERKKEKKREKTKKKRNM